MSTSEYYWENDLMVFTEAYHLRRGYCCKSGCRHCPYEYPQKAPKKRVTISWSGGKDSAYALYKIISADTFDVVSLHTIINEDSRRVGLHGISETLIDKQGEAIGKPIKKVYLPATGKANVYEETMREFYNQCAGDGIEGVVFGDIFLEDLRNYRIKLLETSKMFATFPLWGSDPKSMVHDFIADGFKSIICAADISVLDKEHVGKYIDETFLDILPSNVDACGENGEYHSFVVDGPIFNEPITLAHGDVIKNAYSYKRMDSLGNMENLECAFWFQDLILKG